MLKKTFKIIGFQEKRYVDVDALKEQLKKQGFAELPDSIIENAIIELQEIDKRDFSAKNDIENAVADFIEAVSNKVKTLKDNMSSDDTKISIVDVRDSILTLTKNITKGLK
jgi:transcription initiation factor TFIIIB Brf1 subunit/transcription initiation factor TFIIB